jgi:hypothetical protein
MNPPRKAIYLATLLCLLLVPLPALCTEDAHGLSPAPDMVFMPHLAGFRNKSRKLSRFAGVVLKKDGLRFLPVDFSTFPKPKGTLNLWSAIPFCSWESTHISWTLLQQSVW